MEWLADIQVPTLLLDAEKCRRNIRLMAEKAARHNLIFRPHFKTHQSKTIGEWFRKVGVDKITVSSLRMAEYFADDGWKDITVAFPVNIREIERINSLASRISLHLLVESLELIKLLNKGLRHPVDYYIKIDVGTHRTGLSADNISAINAIVREGDPRKLTFKGFLSHAGHSYQARSKNQILTVHTQALAQLQALKKKYISLFPELIMSYGDTPTCSLAEEFTGIDEIRPGNFVFYDITQVEIGSCKFSDIAVAVACPVVAIHPEREEIVIYGGGIHFSKDRLLLQNGKTIYGVVANWFRKKVDSRKTLSFVCSLSQEHGVISMSPAQIKNTEIGDLLLIWPIHSCMTADLMKAYVTMDGKPIREFLHH